MRNHIPGMELHRSFKVEVIEFVGTVARPQKRPELLAVLQLALDEQGYTTAARVNEHLLGNARPRAAKRLLEDGCLAGALRTSTDEGYSKDSAGQDAAQCYYLTDAGHLALEEQVILLPERGTWQCWYTQDSLVPPCLLHLERGRPYTNHEELKETKRRTVRWPNCLPAIGDEVRVLSGGRMRLDERDTEDPVALPNDNNEAAVCLSWRDEQPLLNVTLPPLRQRRQQTKQLQQETIAFQPAELVEHLNELVPAAIWAQRIQHGDMANASWDEAEGRLCVRFQATTDGERQQLVRHLKEAPLVLGYWGLLRAKTTSPVALFPATQDDAAAWASWRVGKALTKYVTRTEFRALAQHECAPFADAFPALVPPGWEKTLAALEGHQRWYLQAPDDWQLEGKGGN